MKQIKMNVQVDLVKIMGHALTWSTDFNVGVCLGIREFNVKLVICFYSLTELKKKTYKIHWYLQKVHLVTCQLGWYFLVCLWSRNHSTLIHVTKYRPTVNFIIVKYGFIVFTNIQWSSNVNYYFDIILSLLLLYFKIRNNRYH